MVADFADFGTDFADFDAGAVMLRLRSKNERENEVEVDVS